MRRIPIHSFYAELGQAKVKAEEAIETAVEQVLLAAGWEKVAKENVYWPDGDFNMMQARAYDRAAREEVIGRVTMGGVAQEFHRRGYYRESQKPMAPRPEPKEEEFPEEETPEMPPIVTTAKRPTSWGWIAAIIGLAILIGGAK